MPAAIVKYTTLSAAVNAALAAVSHPARIVLLHANEDDITLHTVNPDMHMTISMAGREVDPEFAVGIPAGILADALAAHEGDSVLLVAENGALQLFGDNGLEFTWRSAP